MTKITTIFILSALLSLSLGSLTPTLEKSVFFLQPYNGLTNELYQTRKGILAYSVETVGNIQIPQHVPEYLLIGLESGTATPILADLISDCGQGPSKFSRAHYHATTATLVYYCTNNNSLLIIDEDDYSVQHIITVNTATVFSEVKMTSDGYSVAILGLGSLYTKDPTPSELIRISLQSRSIVNHIVFNHGLTTGEAVEGYATDDSNNLFVSTYTIQGDIYNPILNQTIYSMTLIANSYTLRPIKSLTTAYYSDEYPVDRLYCVGELIFTLLGDNLIILDQRGNKLSNTTTSAVAHEYGTLDLYGLFNPNPDSTDTLQIVKFSVKGTGYSIDYLGNASDIHLVFANLSSNSLLFTIDPAGFNFTVVDLQSHEPVYAANTGYTYENGLMLTNTTYCFFQGEGPMYLQIYNRKTNLLIKSITLAFDYEFYFDEESSVFSYIALEDPQPRIVQIDLQTGEITTPVYITQECLSFNPTIIHATNKGGIPQFTLQAADYDCYVLISEKIGQVEFMPPAPLGDNYGSTLVFDYDLVALYHFAGFYEQKLINMTTFSYHQDSNTFNLSAPPKISQGLAIGQFFPSQNQVVAIAPLEANVIELPSLKETKYIFPSKWTLASSFQDASGNGYAILSQPQAFGQFNDVPGLLSGEQPTDLYGTTANTIQAEATGSCSYWVVDGLITSVAVVRFYNTCNQGEVSSILA